MKARTRSARDMMIGTLSFTTATAALMMTTLCATTARSEPDFWSRVSPQTSQ